MKILIMVHNLTGGGAERVAALWATGFIQRGFDVGIVLNCRKDIPITYSIPTGVKIYNLYGNEYIEWIASNLYRRLHCNIYYIRRLKKVLCDFQPDVAIGVLQPWAEWVRIASLGMGIKIVNTEHNSFERPQSAPMTKQRWQEKYVWNKRYDYVTVLNYADKACTSGHLTNVRVLPNPLTFAPNKDFSHKEKILLAAGRLDDWHYKGFDILAKVWGQVAPLFSEWKLEIAGKGTEQDVNRLRKMMKEAGVADRVTFLGYRADMLSIYQRSSIFILTSRYEGFGMVLIEAMSQGCAPIACDYKGRQREIITNDGEGALCEPEDVKGLADALKKMISNDNYRLEIQKQAVERSKYYNLNNIMDQWEELLKDIK